ncbi:unnamed protein product [Notodromas monacha]|uniref:U6 snRNA phosphodiesterase n=1 Tax=Notodromas monacha TaxID=399045 RepID=A0A7R9BFK1_9CRUS|nr:unnamed protein product [Notodromas monacha]CAG0914503.1 unnamed protein product [Notodromas monacha]
MLNLVNYSDSESPGSSAEASPVLSPKRARLSDGNENRSSAEKSSLPSAQRLNRFLARIDAKLDSPDDHDGRLRSFPHEEGNWATHIYVPIDVSLVMDSLLQVLGEGQDLRTFPLSDLHISLSRTVSIRHHWIPDFEGRLRKVCDNSRKFAVSFSGVDVFVNDERTRTFLSLMVDCGFEQCSKLVGEVDDLFRSFDLPAFYSEQRFHASFAWCLGDRRDQLVNDVLPELIKHFSTASLAVENELSIPMDVPEIRMKAGNKLFRFPLGL